MRLRIAQGVGRRLVINKLDADGNPVGVPFISPFTESRHYREFATKFQLSEDIAANLIQVVVPNQTLPYDHDITPPAPPTIYRTRSIDPSFPMAVVEDTEFRTAITREYPTASAVRIQWQGTDSLCALDGDLHHVKEDRRYTTADLTHFVDSITPAPFMFWITKGGGLRLMFKRTVMYTADELAAGAALMILSRFPAFRFEFNDHTRQPPGQLHERTPDNEVSSIAGLLFNNNPDDDYSEWLAEHGYNPGDKLEHSKCPLRPDHVSKSATPVVVYDDHIYCHSCGGNGLTLGHKTPGYFPLSYLSGSRVDSNIKQCVENFTHWEHAKHIVCKVIEQPKIAEKVYRALLKLRHQEDPRIPMVFGEVCTYGLLRNNGFWTDPYGTVLKTDRANGILSSLPATHYLDGDGVAVSSPARIDYFRQNVDLSKQGYPAVKVIHGIQMTQNQDLPANKYFSLVQTLDLRHDSQRSRRPKYDPDWAIKLESAWQCIERLCPEVQRNVVELCLVGKGLFEHRAGMVPIALFVGTAGSGKTMHCNLAAMIGGDSASAVTYSPDLAKFRAQIASSKKEGSIVLFDEVLKNCENTPGGAIKALLPMLSMTENSMSHELYVGPVRMGDLPFMVWCDTSIPYDVQVHEQYGRRFVFHHFHTKLPDWKITCQQHGLSGVEVIRSQGTEEMVAACNVILSSVIDRFFTGKATDFMVAASQLGFKLLRDSGSADAKLIDIKELYTEVCKTPDPDNESYRKKYARGMKPVDTNSANTLYDLIRDLQTPDEQGTENMRAAQEMDLAKVIGLNEPTKLEILKHGRKFFIRFASIDGKRVNQELSSCMAESPTVQHSQSQTLPNLFPSLS